MLPVHRLASLSLRTKTLVIVVTTLVSLIAFLYIISRSILIQSFSQLESAEIHDHILRVQSALAQKLSYLESVAGDWAPWTATYDFIRGDYDTYVEDNLMDAGFANLDINLMVFLDRAANVVYAKNYDLQNEVQVTVPSDLEAQFVVSSPLLQHETVYSTSSGILLVPEGPLLVASRPVMTSSYEGDPAGTLVVGRFLDAALIEAVSTTTHLPFSVIRLDAPLSPDDQAALAALSPSTPTFITPLDEETISGYFVLQDIVGHPALLVRVDSQRGIYHQGKDALNYLVVSVALVGMVFIVVILVLLETSVLARLASVTTSVFNIAMSGDRSAQVPVPRGKDELWQLATTINQMLESLKRSETQLHESTVLLKEIHHRIKNNLQLISSLLALQSVRIQDESIIQFLKDSQYRIQSIALVHEKLHNSTELSLVDLGEYTRSLVDQIKASIAISDAVTVSVEADCIVLDIDHAAPIGLILNELITNAFKYAFPDGKAGEIKVELRTTGDRQYTITVRDNGIGLPEGMDIHSTSTLGLQLANGLTEQLDGTLQLRRDSGTVIEMTFAKP
jgi:two-component sensor histidine kinase/sensor domain CHASE-containing protein